MNMSSWKEIRASITRTPRGTLFLAEKTGERFLGVRGDSSEFEDLQERAGDCGYFALTAHNAANLRKRLPHLKPSPLGLSPSFGFGDRLGNATPGHARAAARAQLLPVFAQQSVRENARTGRSPQTVLDDAMWGVFESGWQKPWGADADHLKEAGDLTPFLHAGYTFFTVDPGDHVQPLPHSRDAQSKALEALPWNQLQTTYRDLRRTYLNRDIPLPGWKLRMKEADLAGSLITYGRALAHALKIYRRLVEETKGFPVDFEISVDETAHPTTPAAHYLIARELSRLGVCWTSLAPRLTGRFEKGVDFIGNREELDRSLQQHAAVLKAFDSYKISLHSGSDKFSVYPLLARHAGDRVHVKTAGTSYLEALRVLADKEPDLFRKIYQFSRQIYPKARATYHVSAQTNRAPRDVPEEGLPLLLDHFDARQILHVTYGEVLDSFGSRLMTALTRHRQAYTCGLEGHFQRHLAPFS